jgi:signal transduction histidine kinase
MMLDTNRDILAIMGHEILTPLNAIDCYVELLTSGLRGPMTPPQRADLERIRVSGRHLQRLVTNMLTMAGLEHGRVDVLLEDVPLATVLREAGDLVAPQIAWKALHFDHLPCSPNVYVRADADHLRQVLVNLLSNAQKYTPRGGTVVLRSVLQDCKVHVEVQDNGVGIAAEQLEAIFDPFVRLDTRPTSAGLGLGLAISRTIARQMQGDLTVRSTPGKGSVFVITLPRARCN